MLHQQKIKPVYVSPDQLQKARKTFDNLKRIIAYNHARIFLKNIKGVQ